MFIRRLVRLYPRAWRARYEQEFLALLGAHEPLTWRDGIDIIGAAGREWGRCLVGLPTREPAGDLKGLRRQWWIDLLLVGISAELIDLAARSIAGLMPAGVFAGAHAPLLFVQAAVAFRCALVFREPRRPISHVGPRELATWAGVMLVAAVLAHLDHQLSSLAVDSVWLRFSSRPAFNLYLSCLFLMYSTPSATLRTQRQQDLLKQRRRDSVSPSPLGLR
jgi:hypothetical protein